MKLKACWRRKGEGGEQRALLMSNLVEHWKPGGGLAEHERRTLQSALHSNATSHAELGHVQEYGRVETGQWSR